MRVHLYTASLSRAGGGVFEAVAGLARTLLAAGIDVTVVGAADDHFDEDRHAFGAVPLAPYRPSRGSYGLNFRALSDALRERPDVVHIHGIWSANTLYGLTASLAGVPTIVSPHGMLEPWILARRRAAKRVHAALFEHPLLRRSHVHALNEAERRDVAAFHPEVRLRTFVAANGLPEIDARPMTSNKRHALFLGRLHPKKQVLELIAAWRSLDGGPKERLIVAGWGEPEYEAAVRLAASGSNNIEFVGPVHGAAKTEAFAQARFFILPSLSEGMPMAVLEALQSGCIPIITRQCNLPELFQARVAFEMACDFSDFSGLMGRLRERASQDLDELGERASDYARRYAWPTVAAEMIGHYRRVAASR